MHDCTIRQATINDAKGILRVLSLAFKDYRPYYPPEAYVDTVLTENTVNKRLSDLYVYVAVSPDGEIVGTVGWKKMNGKEGHIRGMAVQPEWQGVTDAAFKLLKRVEKDIIEARCSFITLDTTTVLKRAIAFYKKHGYRQSGKVSDFFGFPVYEFKKKL